MGRVGWRRVSWWPWASKKWKQLEKPVSTHQQILFKRVQGSYVRLTPEVSTWKHLRTHRISASSFTAAVIGPSLSTSFRAIHNGKRLQPSVRASNWTWSSIGKCTLIKMNRSLDIWELNVPEGVKFNVKIVFRFSPSHVLCVSYYVLTE